MPTIRRSRREFRKRAPVLTSEEAIGEMLSGPEYPNAAHPALDGFPEAERAALVAEALRRHWAKRDASREPILRERLQKWPVDAWGAVFSEQPDLERTLTPEQRATWEAFKCRGNYTEGIR